MKGTLRLLNVRSLLEEGISRLVAGGIPEPRADAEWLLAKVLGCRRLEVYVKADIPVPRAAAQQFESLVSGRLKRLPLAYLLGEWEFFGLPFEVTPAVLIPRPETELVVATTLNLLERGPSKLVMDVGTGCGNIAVTLAKLLSKMRVVAIDKSEGALAVARRNIDRHEVTDRVTLLQGNLFEPLDSGGVVPGSVELVASNPPYVATSELKGLATEVQQEPREALDGGPDGLSLIRRLVRGASQWLVAGGWLVCEIGASHKEAVLTLAVQWGFSQPQVKCDLAGQPRVLIAQKASVVIPPH